MVYSQNHNASYSSIFCNKYLIAYYYNNRPFHMLHTLWIIHPPLQNRGWPSWKMPHWNAIKVFSVSPVFLLSEAGISACISSGSALRRLCLRQWFFLFRKGQKKDREALAGRSPETLNQVVKVVAPIFIILGSYGSLKVSSYFQCYCWFKKNFPWQQKERW